VWSSYEARLALVNVSSLDYIEGKKIKWKDGAAAVFHIVRYPLLRQHQADAVAKGRDIH
jgi:hypothetical protein